MDFKEALNTLINNEGIEILHDNFRVYSILSDYVGFSHYQVKLINLFCDIYKEYDLIKIFKERGLKEGRKYLTSIYSQYKDVCSFVEFKDAINPISAYICPSEYEEKRKDIDKNRVAIIQKMNKATPKKIIIESNKIDYNEIRGLVINGEAKSIKIEYSENNEFAIYRDGRNRKLDLSKYKLINDTLYFKTRSLKSGNTIKIPKNMRLKLLSIDTNKTNILMNDKIYVDRAFIATNSGSISASVEGSSLTINTVSGIVQFGANSNRIDCHTITGNIFYYFIPVNNKNVSLNISTSNGNIRGFIGLSLKKRITKLLGKIKNVEKEIVVNGCTLAIKHSTVYGKIVIK